MRWGLLAGKDMYGCAHSRASGERCPIGAAGGRNCGVRVQTKLWYVRTAAFEMFSDHVGLSKPAGVPSDTKALGALATEAVQHVMSSSAEVKGAATRVLRVMHDMRPDIVARTLTAQNTTNADHEEVLQVSPPPPRASMALRGSVC